MRRIDTLILATCVLFTWLIADTVASTAALADDRLWRDLFIEQAPQAWRDYHAHARNLQGSWLEIVTDSTGKEPKTTRTRYEMKQRAGAALIVEESVPSRDGRGSQTASIANDSYQFVLQRSSPEREWVLGNRGKRIWRESTIDHPRHFADVVTRLPFTVPNGFDPLGLQDPGVTVTNVQPSPSANKQLVKIDFTYFPPTKAARQPLRRGSVFCNPARYWLIEKYELESEYGTARAFENGTLTYLERNDKPPILKEIVNRRKLPSCNGDIEFRFVYDLGERHVPAADFMLSGYGLPEPKSGRRGTSQAFLWLAGGAVFCFLAAILLKRMAARRKAG